MPLSFRRRVINLWKHSIYGTESIELSSVVIKNLGSGARLSNLTVSGHWTR